MLLSWNALSTGNIETKIKSLFIIFKKYYVEETQDYLRTYSGVPALGLEIQSFSLKLVFS